MLITPASTVTMYPHIYRPIAYDVFTDLAPVPTVAATRFMLVVGPKAPPSVQAFPDFVR